MLSVRLVKIDHYITTPVPTLDVSYSEFRGSEIKQVPVIRIFGSTSAGEKTCVHVHGIFPYFYIPYDASCDSPERFMYQLSTALDKALNVARGKTNSNSQHVFKVVLVCGIPFYGYHNQEYQFLKIYLYNPLLVKKASELLQNGAVLNKLFQPHEVHIPFSLQFMIDYNLFGMSYVNFKTVKFRRTSAVTETETTYSEDLLLPVEITRVSTCKHEVDVIASDILNRKLISVERYGAALNPGLAGIWEDEKQRRRDEGRNSQITPQISQPRPSVFSTDSELFFKQRLKEIIVGLKIQSEDMQVTDTQVSHNKEVSYPVEAPHGSDLLEASFIDDHKSTPYSPKSKETFQDPAVNKEIILKIQSSHENVKSPLQFDSEDEHLLELLQGLEAPMENNIDNDSILGSQIMSTEQFTEYEECEFDFSQPLVYKEHQESSNPDCSSTEMNLCLSSKTLSEARDSSETTTNFKNLDINIPQLDGADDDSDSSQEEMKMENQQAVMSFSSEVPNLSLLDEFTNTEFENMALCNVPKTLCETDFKFDEPFESELDFQRCEEFHSLEHSSVMNTPESESMDEYRILTQKNIDKNSRVTCENFFELPVSPAIESDFENYGSFHSLKNSSVMNTPESESMDIADNSQICEKSPSFLSVNNYSLCDEECDQNCDHIPANFDDSEYLNTLNVGKSCDRFSDVLISDPPFFAKDYIDKDSEEDMLLKEENLTSWPNADPDRSLDTVNDDFLEFPPYVTPSDLSDAWNDPSGQHSPVASSTVQNNSSDVKPFDDEPGLVTKSDDIYGSLERKSEDDDLLTDVFVINSDILPIFDEMPPLSDNEMESTECNEVRLTRNKKNSQVSRRSGRKTKLNYQKKVFKNILHSGEKKNAVEDNVILCSEDVTKNHSLENQNINVLNLSNSSKHATISGKGNFKFSLRSNYKKIVSVGMQDASATQLHDSNNCNLDSNDDTYNLRHKANKSVKGNNKSEPDFSENSSNVSNIISKSKDRKSISHMKNSDNGSSKVSKSLRSKLSKAYAKSNSLLTENSNSEYDPYTFSEDTDNDHLLLRRDSRFSATSKKSCTSKQSEVHDFDLQRYALRCYQNKTESSEIRKFDYLTDDNPVQENLVKSPLSDITMSSQSVGLSTCINSQPRVILRRSDAILHTKKVIDDEIQSVPSTSMNSEALETEVSHIKRKKKSVRSDMIGIQNNTEEVNKCRKTTEGYRHETQLNERLGEIHIPKLTIKRLSENLYVTVSSKNVPVGSRQEVQPSLNATDCSDFSYKSVSGTSEHGNFLHFASNTEGSEIIKPDIMTKEKSSDISKKNDLENGIQVNRTSKVGENDQKLMNFDKNNILPGFEIRAINNSYNTNISFYPSQINNQGNVSCSEYVPCFKSNASARILRKRNNSNPTLTVPRSLRPRKKLSYNELLEDTVSNIYNVRCSRGVFSSLKPCSVTLKRLTVAQMLKYNTVSADNLFASESFEHFVPSEVPSQLALNATKSVFSAYEKIICLDGTVDSSSSENSDSDVSSDEESSSVPSLLNPLDDNASKDFCFSNKKVSGALHSNTSDNEIYDFNAKATVVSNCTHKTTSNSHNTKLLKSPSKCLLKVKICKSPNTSSSKCDTSSSIRFKRRPEHVNEQLSSKCDLTVSKHVKSTGNEYAHMASAQSNEVTGKKRFKLKTKSCVEQPSCNESERLPISVYEENRQEIVYGGTVPVSNMISNIPQVSIQKVNSPLKEHEKSRNLMQSEIKAIPLRHHTKKHEEDLSHERQKVNSNNSVHQLDYSHVESESLVHSDENSDTVTPENSLLNFSSHSHSAFNKIFKNLPTFTRHFARRKLYFSLPSMQNNISTADTQLIQNNACDSEANKLVIDFGDKTLNKTECATEKYSITNSDDNCNKSIRKKLMPVAKTPSGDDIQKSLTAFGYSECVSTKPFYSNILDVSSRKEVGSKILKVASCSVSELEYFVTNLPDIVTLNKWREIKRDNMNTSQTHHRDDNVHSENSKLSFCSERLCVITPALLPPAPHEVQLWIKARKLLEEKNKEEALINRKTYQTVKMMVPSSPGDNEDSVSEISLTPHSLDTVHSSPVDVLRTNLKTFPASHSTPYQIQAENIESIEHSPVVISNNEINSDSESSATPTCVKTPESSSTIVRNQMSPILEEDLSSQKEINSRQEKSPPNSQTSLDDPSLRKLLLKSQFKNQFTTPKGAKRRVSTGCQIEGVTLNNTHGFKMSFENLQDGRSLTLHQHLTILTVELHIETRGDLKPDPAVDPIRAFFYLVTNDVPDDSDIAKSEYGVIVNPCHLTEKPYLYGTGVDVPVTYVEDEKDLLSEIEKLIRRTDPDFFIGYEVEMLSWGFLFRRAYTLGINFCPLVSRIPSSKNESYMTDESEESGKQDIEMNLAGRIMLNAWRLMRHEISLQSYTFENIMYHILHERVPLYSFRKLTQWWNHSSPFYRWIVVEHYMVRVKGIMAILDQLDLISRTSELARLFGIQFYEVLSRGSQFRVESMMLRMAKPSNFVALSPSIQQRAKMRAPECLQLIMEPESRFYTDPVIVLDFQSLYPSMIIAYNYCFSTCLGRVEHLGQPNRFDFGCSQLKIPLSELSELENNINISPCGVAFVNSKVRLGILPQMLEEILNTRLMVKKSMKEHKNNKILQRVLHARQLGLKLIANVTYGYTAANFSGRMPCVEVADSVVSKGRETLERAINLVEKNSEWKAKVIYGDTDSLFVLVEGRSRKQAFKIGSEIAEAVTNVNPKPVKLKLEKVYQPCILQTKKRYVGYMYESPEQIEPVYDAKGIETVRRDGCPAVAKILEKSLRILFESADVSQVKSYVCHQFDKILQGNLNIQDLIFAREYRGMSGYKPGACVPALELAERWLESDKRAEPRVSERVPYVIINGPPGLPLIRCVRSPTELITDPSLRINSLYYVTKVIIPPLDRCFSLLGADVDAWFADIPRKYLASLPSVAVLALKKSTISQYFSTMNCVSCEELTNNGLCSSCQDKPQKTAFILSNKMRIWERTYDNITKVCQSCCGHFEPTACISIDCPTYFRRNLALRDLNQAPFLQDLYCQNFTF